MKVQIPYGSGSIMAEVPDSTKVVEMKNLPAVADVASAIRTAVQNPIGSRPLREIARGKSDAVIVINDITRPTPTRDMLIVLLEELKQSGINMEQVKIGIACGNHRPSTDKDLDEMIGADLAAQLEIFSHNCEDSDNLTYLGETKRKMPVWVNSIVAKSSIKILTGLITPHHSAGYSGGRKSILPGVAGIKSLSIHHSFPIRPFEPSMGWMEGNPFHEEALEGAKLVGVDFIVNVVSNVQGEVVAAVAGDLDKAHKQGVKICEESWGIEIDKKFDVVITSPGGFPRDYDLHQAQKAVSAAEMVVNEGGVIILVAECPERIGKFEFWLKEAKSPQEVIDRFNKEGFTKDQSSKAFMLARALVKHQVYVINSYISEKDLTEMHFKYASSVEKALSELHTEKGSKELSVLLIPYAIDCIPIVKVTDKEQKEVSI